MQFERFNQIIAAMLAKDVIKNQKDWDTDMPHVLMTYCTVHGILIISLVVWRFKKNPFKYNAGTRYC